MHRPHPARRFAAAVVVLALAFASLISFSAASASAASRPFTDVLNGIYRGDMVMATNSNLTVGSKSASATNGNIKPAQIDGSTDDLCPWTDVLYPATQAAVKTACNNSSAAVLDIPANAKVVSARLYVMNTLQEKRPATEVRLAGPSEGFNYRIMGENTPSAPKLSESSTGKVGDNGGNYAQAIMRQSVWDVTDLVNQLGGGEYKIADIPSEPFSTWTPWATWAITAVYEWDSNSGTDFKTLTPEQQYRFIPRSIAWTDGNLYSPSGVLETTANNIVVPDAGKARFGKTFHQAAHANVDWTDSATLNGVALGNNNAAGNSAPPPGVSLGNRAECNSTTDVQNETICYLGNYVTDQPIAGSGYQKRPGMGYFASNTTFNGAGQPTGKPSNSVGYDADIIRIPDAAIPPGTTQAKLSMKGNGEWLDFGMAGISIDLPSVDPTVTKTVQKVDGTGPVLPGDELEYTISAQNEGKDVGVAGFLTDTLPAGVSYVPNSMRVTQGFDQGAKTDDSDTDSASFVGGTVLWRPGNPNDVYTDPNSTGPQEWVKQPDGRADYSLDESNADGPQTLKFRVKVNADQAGQTISNEARFTLTGVKSNLSLGNSGSAAVEVARPVPGSFTVAKSVDQTTANPGDVLTYTVTVKQAGGTAVDASFGDDLAAVAGAEYVAGSATADLGSIGSGAPLQWSGTLQPGQTATVSYQMKIKPDIAIPGEVSNTVVPGDKGTCEPGTCTTKTKVPLGFTVAKQADRAVANPGDTITYTVTVKQSGEQAVAASFKDDLSAVAGTDYEVGSATADKGTIAPDNLLSWSGNLGVGETAVISYKLKVKADLATPGEIRNAVLPGDRGVCETGKCTTVTTVPEAGTYSLEKTADKKTAKPGEIITYTVKVTQSGDAPVNTSFVDDLSKVAGAGYVAGSATADKGTIAADNPVNWSATLAKGEVATVTYQMKVQDDIATPAAVKNAVVAGDRGVCQPGKCEVTTEISTPSSFGIVKSVDRSKAAPGDVLTYTVKVTQRGDAAIDASFADDLAKVAGASYVAGSATADKGRIAADNPVNWSGTLAKGEVATISYKMRIDPQIEKPATIKNTVLPGDKGTCEPGDCGTETQVPLGYFVEKSVDKTTAAPGDVITYTVKVSQTGELATDASFSDDLAKISSADYVAGSATADKGSLSGALNWSGTLAKGEVATISYQMKIKTDVQTPAEAKNLVVPGAEGSCRPGKCETTTTVSTPSGFQVQKLVDLETAAPGDTIMFQITVAQTGDGTVDAAFTDDLSAVAGALLVPGSITVNQGTVAADNPIKWSGTLAKGEVATVMFLMKVNADISTPGAVLNQAVPGVNGVCAPAGCDTVTRVLTPGTFTVEKTATPASAVPGDLVSYTIKVTQQGDTPASASFEDDLAKVVGASYVPGSATLEGAGTIRGELGWDGTMLKGDVATISYQMKVNADAAPGSQLKNAVVPGQDGRCEPGKCETTTDVLAPGTFAVEKTADKSAALPGDLVTYTVKVTQRGDLPVDASFADDLSAIGKASYVTGSATADVGAVTGALNWSGTLAKGSVATISYQVKVAADAAGSQVKNLVVPGGKGTCEPGKCETTTEVLTPGSFTVAKTATPGSVQPGDEISYTVKVSQLGDVPVDASFADDLSKVVGAAYVAGSATADKGAVTGAVDWSGTLNKGETATITYRMKVNADVVTPAEVKNTVVPGGKGTCEPGKCETTTEVLTPGSFTVLKSADKSSTVPGEVITYTVKVTQQGDLPVDASFADDLAQVAGAAYVADSARADQGAVTGALNWSGTLAKGASATVTYQMRVNADVATPAQVKNTVVPGGKGTCEPGKCETTTEVLTPGNFTVAKTATPGSVQPGDEISYQVVVTQNGDTAAAASFADDLAQVAGAAYVAGSATADKGTVTGAVDWSGTLNKGETATITYRMKVNADVATPAEVKNTVVPGGKGTCEPGKCETTTEVLTPGSFTVAKSVDKTNAAPGELLTYTVKITQQGDLPVDASFADDLAQVAGAAYVAGSATADVGAVTGALNWSGTLAKGAGATVTYQMRVNADVATPAQVKNLVVPGGKGTCEPGKCETTTAIPTPGTFMVIKSADRKTAAPGEVISYTVTVSHRGETAVDASFADELSQVTGASYVAGSAKADRGTVSGALNWSGRLENGQTATVTYQMKVNADVATPGSVKNTVVPGDKGTCAEGSCETTTEVLTPGSFTVKKSVDRDNARPGDLLSYTVTVSQRGDTEVAASFADDLSKVLGAEYLPGSATADAGTVTGALNWSGTLAKNQVATVRYQMKVKPDLVTPAELKNTVIPGERGGCQPDGCVTTTEVIRDGGFVLSKKVNSTEAKPGDVLSFTVTVTQTGDTPVAASFADDLSKVAGATYLAGSARADQGTVTGAVNWSGTLAKGASATVTYQMKINADVATPGAVKNTVVPGGNGLCRPGECETTTTVTTVIVPPDPKPPVTPEPPVGPVTQEPLPETGAAVLPWLAGGAALVFAGLAFAVAAGTRRRAASE